MKYLIFLLSVGILFAQAPPSIVNPSGGAATSVQGGPTVPSSCVYSSTAPPVFTLSGSSPVQYICGSDNVYHANSAAFPSQPTATITGNNTGSSSAPTGLTAAQANAITDASITARAMASFLTAQSISNVFQGDGFVSSLYSGINQAQVAWASATLYGNCQSVVYSGSSYVLVGGVANSGVTPGTNTGVWYPFITANPVSGPDCAYAYAASLATTTNTSTALKFGAGTYGIQNDWRLPALASAATVVITGAGFDQTILQRQTYSSTNAVIAQLPGPSSNIIQLFLSNFVIDANFLAPACADLDGIRRSYLDMSCQNLATGDHGFKIGNTGGQPHGAYEIYGHRLFMRQPTYSGIVYPVVTVAPVSGSITTASYTIVSGGSSLPSNMGLIIYGYNVGHNPCSVNPSTPTLTIVGGVLTAIVQGTSTGSGCPAGTYDVQVRPISPTSVAMRMYTTDSTWDDLRISDVGSSVGIQWNFSGNQIFHEHLFSAQPIQVQDLGGNNHYGLETDTPGHYGLDIEGNDVNVFGWEKIWSSSVPGSSDVFVAGSVTRSYIDGPSCTSSQSGGDYHEFVMYAGTEDSGVSVPYAFTVSPHVACGTSAHNTRMGDNGGNFYIPQVILNAQSGYGGDLLDANLNGVNQFAVLNGGGINVGPNSNTATNISIAGGRTFLQYNGTNALVGGGASRGLALEANSVVGAYIDTSQNFCVGTSVSACSSDSFSVSSAGAVRASSLTGTGSAPTITGFNSITPGLIYSAAGTALPTCAVGIKGEDATVSDASGPLYMTAYTSGGGITTKVICSYNGTTYSWLTH